jgi:hypothetical protein
MKATAWPFIDGKIQISIGVLKETLRGNAPRGCEHRSLQRILMPDY